MSASLMFRRGSIRVLTLPRYCTRKSSSTKKCISRREATSSLLFFANFAVLCELCAENLFCRLEEFSTQRRKEPQSSQRELKEPDNEMNLTLRVWRQKNNDTPGK